MSTSYLIQPTLQSTASTRDPTRILSPYLSIFLSSIYLTSAHPTPPQFPGLSNIPRLTLYFFPLALKPRVNMGTRDSVRFFFLHEKSQPPLCVLHPENNPFTLRTFVPAHFLKNPRNMKTFRLSMFSPPLFQQPINVRPAPELGRFYPADF